ncbi:hypothetical protein IC611_16155 [Proteus mirabilis]
MRTFAINQHNDLVIDAKGDLQICDNDEAVKTFVSILLKRFVVRCCIKR